MYLLTCKDKTGALELRMANRPAHLEWVATHSDTVSFAGPMVDDADENLQGSVFLLRVDSRAEAEAFNAADPYTKAGLWQDVAIQRVRQVVPALQAS